jgi:hypothetical protein
LNLKNFLASTVAETKMEQSISHAKLSCLANEGSNDLEAPINSVTPTKEIQICYNTPKASEFLLNKIQKWKNGQ